MEKHSDKINKLFEENNKIFNEAWGFRNPFFKKPEAEQEGIGQVVKVGEGVYRMGKSKITRLRGISEYYLLNFDFQNSPLNWLFDAQFEGELTLKLTGNVELTTFNGVWMDGIFKGRYFASTSVFKGGQFGDEDSKPVFLPQYTGWKASPYFFFNGIIENTGGGVLGIPNLVPGNIDQAFNLLAIKPGNTITINLVGGVKHQVTCIKRLEGSNRMFIYEVVDGKIGKTFKVNYDWSDIRGTDKVSFHKNTTINFQSPSLNTINVFKLDVSEGIESATISIAGTSGPVSEPEEPQDGTDFAITQQQYDLGKIPGLNLKAQQRGPGGKMLPLPTEAKGNAYFYIPDESYMSKFSEVVSNIENGTFQKDISLVKSAIKNGIINGAGKDTPYLIPVFGQEGNNKLAPAEIVASMKRLDDFMRFFVDRMYIQGDNNSEDAARQKFATDKLKAVLGLQTQETPEEPKPEVPTKKVKKVKMKEFRELIQNIISDNL